MEEQKTQLMELTMKGSDTNDSVTTNNVSNEIDGNDIIKHGKKLGGETNEHVDALQRETKQPAAAVSISASSLFSLATFAAKYLEATPFNIQNNEKVCSLHARL